MRRFGRRTELERLRQELPLQPFYFDLLYLDGVPFIDHPQAERFSKLLTIAPESQIVPGWEGPIMAFAIAFPSSDNGIEVEYDVNLLYWIQEYGPSE